jgi:hypothetical protein
MNEPGQQPEFPANAGDPNGKGSVLAGFGLAAVINLGAAIVGIVTIVVPLAIGLIQAAWIVPMVLSFRKSGKSETAKGILIAATITFLLNAGCWGLVATSLSSGSMR